jgi:farnesyl-diphosphate farnesyltransferase
LLASVSRSFYLTLKALPRELREPISLAYLLARTADTIADTAAVPASLRLSGLGRFQTLIEGENPALEADLVEDIRRQFLPLQADPAEHRLVERLGDGLAWLRTMHGPSLTAIQGVLRPIIRGQTLDIERFPADGQLRSLPSAEALHEYTWMVAGCVGEFWTEMCALEKPGALDPAIPLPQMQEWGACMGRGLQLINILRDIGEDIGDGRCYLPESDWTAAGLSLADVEARSPALRPVWLAWLEISRAHLDAGLNYVRHVADSRLRYATALPLLLGAKTLSRMAAAPWSGVISGIKISRLDVGVILAEAALASRSPEKLDHLFRKLSG